MKDICIVCNNLCDSVFKKKSICKTCKNKQINSYYKNSSCICSQCKKTKKSHLRTRNICRSCYTKNLKTPDKTIERDYKSELNRLKPIMIKFINREPITQQDAIDIVCVYEENNYGRFNKEYLNLEDRIEYYINDIIEQFSK